jgi:hypothetical protein
MNEFVGKESCVKYGYMTRDDVLRSFEEAVGLSFWKL